MRTTIAALLLTLVGTVAAHAAPVITYAGGLATGVQDLQVNGQTYDVVFDLRQYDTVFADAAPTFWGDNSGAEAAKVALLAVLGGADAVKIGDETRASGLVVVPYSQGSYTQSGVVIEGFTSKQLGYDRRTAGTWTGWGDVTMSAALDMRVYNYAFAVFDLKATEVPEPASAALMGLALAGLALSLRRRASVAGRPTA